MQESVQELAQIQSPELLSAWILAHPDLCTRKFVEELLQGVLQLGLSDRPQAARLADAALAIADTSGDPVSRGLAMRSQGHVFYAAADYSSALMRYDASLALFDQSNCEIEAARTMNSALQSLIYLGEFDRAYQWAEKARVIFSRAGDQLRLSRLTSNIGNILYRQDRHREAIALYEEALTRFREIGAASDIAAALSNVAVCRITLGDFEQALAAYTETRSHCSAHGFTQLVAAADYNIAYLHYLTGDYTRALDLYHTTRQLCTQTGDAYHAALCDLDQAEMYLDLNLNAEGLESATRAARAFKILGMPYERGKALVSLAVAKSRERQSRVAISLFRIARRVFEAQGNKIWPAVIDLYEAIFWSKLEKPARAWRLCVRAQRIFRGTHLPGKAEACYLLKAQLLLGRSRLEPARRACLRVLNKSATGSPAQCAEAEFLIGSIEQRRGRPELALAHYERAREDLRGLRDRLWNDSSRISFLTSKLAVYQELFALYVQRGEFEKALLCVEEVKSRTISDRLANPQVISFGPELERLRCELYALYREIENSALSQAAFTTQRLRERAARYEQLLGRYLGTVKSVASPETFSLTEIRSALSPRTLLLEYYESRGAFYVLAVSRENIWIERCGDSAAIQHLTRLLRFQLMKPRLTPDLLEQFADRRGAAVTAHLSQLYCHLIHPVTAHLPEGADLIIIPHGVLHRVPFHALYDGQQFLIDRFAVSYAPGAGIFSFCQSKLLSPYQASLVLGVPDERAPQIEPETRAVAAVLPEPAVLLSSAATESALRRLAPLSRFIHIATHGIFRADNPLFSSIRLSNGYITFLDLCGIRLNAELVTLSGCSTGLNSIVGPDEVMGLVRGLLLAGARSMLVSLWDVNDQAATELMSIFYSAIQTGIPKSAALRKAMGEIRSRFDDPFYWAPFVLVGGST